MSPAAIEAIGVFAVIVAAVLFGAGAVAGALTPRADLHRVQHEDDDIEGDA